VPFARTKARGDFSRELDEAIVFIHYSLDFPRS
jgi:hypothetical protein